MSVELRESSPASLNNGVVPPAGDGSRSSAVNGEGTRAKTDCARETPNPDPMAAESLPCGAPSPQARAELRPRAPVWNLTVGQVAGFLQKSEKTIDRMVAAQEIGSTKIGRNRLFPREEVCRLYAERFLAGRRLQPGEGMQIAERALAKFLGDGKSQAGVSKEIADLRRRIEALERWQMANGRLPIPKEAA